MIVTVSVLNRVNIIPFRRSSLSEISLKKRDVGGDCWDKLIAYPELTVTSTLYVPCSVTSMPQSRLSVSRPPVVA